MDLDDEESLGKATLNKSMDVSVSHLEQAEVVAHFHVYVECLKMELSASFDGSQYSKNKTQSHFTR